VSGGLNVYPSEVERVLAEHPAVRQVAVVGAPNSEWGEEVVAYVVRDASLGAGESELTVWVRARLAGYKKPRRIVFVETMPVGANGKILKRQLRDRLWAEHDRRIG
jgi:acyl-CoA synthetase (AMP-forming)/AMP-acid ligase II